MKTISLSILLGTIIACLVFAVQGNSAEGAGIPGNLVSTPNPAGETFLAPTLKALRPAGIPIAPKSLLEQSFKNKPVITEDYRNSNNQQIAPNNLLLDENFHERWYSLKALGRIMDSERTLGKMALQKRSGKSLSKIS